MESFEPRLRRGALILGLVCCVISAASAERPNIVLVMADDQGWGDMAYNGHPVLQTPNFDKAAAECLRFDRFYAAGPVCSPTRASVVTGRHPNRMGVFKWGHPIRPQEVTLAEALKSSGYATAHFGKWHLGSVRRASPVNPGKNGFDHWVSAPNFYDNDPIFSHGGKAVQHKGESSIVTADEAIRWMGERAAQEAPFLAVIWFGSPHGPHQAADEDLAHYEQFPRNKAHFYGEITGMDRAYGKIRTAIKELGIRENTLLWYCSDNGALPKVGSSGGRRGQKGSIYEGGLLVPSILEWPAVIKVPRTSSLPFTTCDIYPTLLEAAGTKAAHQPPLDGVSVLPWFDGRDQNTEIAGIGRGFWDYPARGIGTPSAKWMKELLAAQEAGGDLEPHEASKKAAKLPDPPVSSDAYPGHAAWTMGRWKLHRIERPKQKNKTSPPAVVWELYDLEKDPKEQTNLIGEPEAAATKEVLSAELAKWLLSVVQSLNGMDYPK